MRSREVCLPNLLPTCDIPTDSRLSASGVSGYDQSVDKKQFMSHFTSFAAPVQRMLELAPEESIKLWDLLDMELQPSFIKEKAVLIGDAAHPFLPCELAIGNSTSRN